jgi:hypothetical protein
MCEISLSRIRIQKRKPYRVRRDADDTIVLEDWMCAGAQTAHWRLRRKFHENCVPVWNLGTA